MVFFDFCVVSGNLGVDIIYCVVGLWVVLLVGCVLNIGVDFIAYVT